MHDIYDVVLNKKTSYSSKIKTERSSFGDIKYDMWRVGLILLKLMTCSSAEKFNTKKFTYQDSTTSNNEINKMIEKVPKVYGKALHTLLRSLLSINPSQRPDSSEIIQQNLIFVHKKVIIHN